MGRRADEPLEKRDMILFKGDWDKLVAFLSPRKVKPTVFIRHLVRNKIREIEARTDLQSKPVAELKDDDIDLGDLASESATEPAE